MILRDFQCPSCKAILCDRFSDDTRMLDMCPRCDEIVMFEALCNGGLRSRYRFADWPSDPEFYRGQVSVVGAEATDSEGNQVRRYNSETKEAGAPMTDAPQYHNGTDERETRRDMIKHATRRTRGTLPIVSDMGAAKNG